MEKTKDITKLIADYHAGALTRRKFCVQAVALGLSANMAALIAASIDSNRQAAEIADGASAAREIGRGR